MSSDSSSRTVEYVREVSELDPQFDADDILAKRRAYLNEGFIIAEFVDDGLSEMEHRGQVLAELRTLRDRFWQTDASLLNAKLSQFGRSPFPEVATAAMRLRQVAQQIDSLRQFGAEAGVHKAFLRLFAEILVAPASSANKLRERGLSWMRPEQNPGYEMARKSQQSAARRLQSQYPGVFALEEAWLTEILEYDAHAETEDQASNVLLGFALIGATIFTIYVTITIVQWISQ